MKNTNYAQLVKPFKDVMLQKLNEYVAINSVYDESTADKENPFGIGVSKALKWFYDLATSDGFVATNYSNKVVEVLVGKGPKNITIMAHCDVVPATGAWDHDPFKVENKKDVLTGRGVADDKGPLLSCYYALKALRDSNLLGDYQVRFLVGGNEESGSLCMHHYFVTLKKPMPTYGFSPDSNFPVVFAEKGIFNFSVKKTLDIPNVISIEGGEASNSVIETCTVKIHIDNEVILYVQKHYPKADITTIDDIVTITFHGVAAHGSTPQLGKNAGMMAIEFLANYTKNKEMIFLKERFTNVYGDSLNANGFSIDMGYNSLNVGIVKYKDRKFEMIVNFRYVNTCNLKELKETIKENSKPFVVSFLGDASLLYFPKDSKLISTLLKAYQDETGDKKSKPLAIGGGTYAKEADNVVAFGIEFPGEDYKMHSSNEQIKVRDLVNGMAIFAHAIHDLGKVIENED